MVVVTGQRSGTVSVESGVQQSIVLGPLLFVLHINDLTSVFLSQVRLFAGDCPMYLPIESIGDQEDFQRWSDSWGMRFNKKCHIMRVSKSTRPLSKFYYLCITSLSEVNCAKYLRVNITNDLQWSNQISGISSQANSSLGLIREISEVAFKSLKRLLTW